MENFSKDKYIELISRIYFKWGGTVKINNEKQKEDYMNANLLDLTFDTPIYRIFKIERLISTLKEKELCLVKPKLWDDPFENSLLNSTGILDDGTPVSFEPIREQYYGQCWSLKEECDGLWRNYTSNSCERCSFCDYRKRHGHSPVSAKVKTTVGKLMNAFYDETNPFHSLCYFMGKVRYSKTDDIVNYLKAANVTDTTNINQVLSLLIKRESFSYEEEVRLIFTRPDNSDIDLTNVKNPWESSSDFYKFKIDPNSLFDEIELNPWMDNNSCASTINEIRKYYTGPVEKSKLYNHPFFKIRI
ncbi:MAG: hypothetical protein IJU90_08555 [Bacteroidales bacterium]|nr:hypothetical protein [Bacteroidales bacterium]